MAINLAENPETKMGRDSLEGEVTSGAKLVLVLIIVFSF